MKSRILFFALVVGVAAFSALTTRHLTNRVEPPTESIHQWLHQHLELTDEQAAAIDGMEADFARAEIPLREAFARANRDLALTIREEGAYTPAVAAAVEHVHHQMGELQKQSIAHLFQMSTVLDPEQKTKLMDAAEMALTEDY